MKVTVGQITDKGLKRQANEDNLLALPSRGVFIVADGVGGRRGGQTASHTVAEVFEKVFTGPQPLSSSDLPMEDLRRLVHETIDLCNQKIYTEAEMNQELDGMATTLAMAAVRENRAIVAHVGDSRVYRCDARGLVRLTEDHSEVNEAVRQGWMTAEQAEVHPRRNVISRAIGADSEVEPEIIEIEVDETTTLLLCSDGITRHIRDEQLERLLRSGHHPQSICETMKQLCYEAGAEDNLTAIVVDFGERGYIDEQTRPAVRSNSEAATADKPRKKIEIVLNEPEPEAQPAQEAESQKVEEVPAEAPVEKPAPASASPMPEPPSVPQRTRKQREINIAPTKEVEQKVEMSKFMRMSVLIVTLLAGFILGGLFGGPLQQLVNRAGGPLAEEQPRVLRWTPKDAGVAAAYAQFQQGRPENAQKELNDILARSPNNPDAHFCFGRIYFAQKEYHEAIKHFEVAVNNDPELDEAWVFIALAYLQSGTPNRNAADSLQKLITPNAPSPQATSSSASPKPSATPAG